MCHVLQHNLIETSIEKESGGNDDGCTNADRDPDGGNEPGETATPVLLYCISMNSFDYV